MGSQGHESLVTRQVFASACSLYNLRRPYQAGLGTPACHRCRLLLYTPRHPFIRQALKAVTQNVLSNFTERSGSQRTAGIIRMTGPSGYHEGGVIPLLEGNGCVNSALTGVRDTSSFAVSVLT